VGLVHARCLGGTVGVPLRPDDPGDEDPGTVVAEPLPEPGEQAETLAVNPCKFVGVGEPGTPKPVGSGPEGRRADLHGDIVAAAHVEVLAIDRLQGLPASLVFDQPGDPHVGVEGMSVSKAMRVSMPPSDSRKGDRATASRKVMAMALGRGVRNGVLLDDPDPL
jgi:hypothetical protein